MEGDLRQSDNRFLKHLFLSTPSGWRATLWAEIYLLDRGISIHALRVEGDSADIKLDYVVAKFLSTPSGWRATMDSDW